MLQINEWISGFEWLRFFRIAGLIVCVSFFYYRIVKENLKIHPVYLVLLLLFFCFSCLIGSRFFGLLETAIVDQAQFNWGALFNSPRQGFMRWYGGMLVLALGVMSIKQLAPSKKSWQLMDIFSMALCISIVVVAQGCQFSGDGCYGIPTTLPWGMHYAYGEVPSILPVHPTPIYNSIFHLAFFAFLLQAKRKISLGKTTFIFFTGSSIFCFLLEFIRNNEAVIMGLTLAQVTYAIIVLVMLVNYLTIYQSKKIMPLGVPIKQLKLNQVK